MRRRLILGLLAGCMLLVPVSIAWACGLTPIVVPRPEQDDAFHNFNLSPCTGYVGVRFESAGSLSWRPVHNSEIGCAPFVYDGAVALYSGFFGHDDFSFLNEPVEQITCDGNPCYLDDIADPHARGPFTFFYHTAAWDLGLSPEILKGANGYYVFVWGPPTTFCASPTTSGVSEIHCSYTELDEVASPTTTHLG